MRQLRMVRRTNRLMAAAVVVVIMAVASAQRACAQGTMGAVPDPISTRDLERYATRLDLSRHQRMAVESMHETYREEYGRLRDGDIEKFMNSTRNMGGGLSLLMDRTATRKAFKDLDDVLNKIKAIDTRFFDQMQSVLTEEQMSRVTQVRQMRERVRYRSGLSRLTAFINPGVAVDLSELAEDLTLSPQEKELFMPALAQYESSLTSASRRLYEATSSLVVEALDALQTPDLNEQAMADPQRRGQMFQNFRAVLGEIQLKLAARAADINDLNRRALRTFAGALSPENARVVREEFIRRAYPEIRGGGSTAMRAFAIVFKFQELTEQQRQSVSALGNDFHAAWDRLIEQAMDQVDSNRKTQSFFDMDRDTRRAQAEQMAALRERRTQLNDAAIENLRAVLAPEQGERMDKLLAQNKDGEEEVTATALIAPGAGGGGFAVAARVSGPAQGVHAVAADPFLPRAISRGDVDGYAARLNLSSDQRGLLNGLHADYNEAYRDLEDGPIKEVRQSQRSLWAMNPGGGALTPPSPQAVDSLHVLRKRAVVAILDLDKKFFDDLQVLLGGSVDAARVQRLHNARLRDIYSQAAQQASVMNFAGGRRDVRGGGPAARAVRMMSGESGEAGVDLAAIVDSMQLHPSDPASFDASLAEYERSALSAFQKLFDAALNMQLSRDKMLAEAAADERDGERGGRMGDGFRMLTEGDGRVANEARRTIASLNRQTLTRLTELLDGADAAELRRAYNHKAFPDVFRDPRSAQPHLDGALNLPNLSDQQRAQVQDIALEFRTQYDEINEKLIELETADSAAGAGGRNRDWQTFGERMRTREKVEFDRNDLHDRTLAKLRAALNEQQVQQLGGLQPLPREE